MSSSFVFMNLIDIVIAVVIDWIIGDPYWFPHPVIYIGKFISYLEKKGRKLCKKDESLKAFGGLIVFLVAFVSFIIPFIVLLLLRKNIILYNIVNTFIISCSFNTNILISFSLLFSFS